MFRDVFGIGRGREADEGAGEESDEETGAGEESDEEAGTAPDDLPGWLHLSADEAVVWESRPHPVELGPGFPVALAVLLLALVAAGWSVLERGVGLVTAGALLVAVVAGAVVCIRYVFWTCTRYVITSAELYEKRGVVSLEVTQFRLERVQNTSLSQTTLGRLLGYGDLTVYTAGSGDPELTFERLPSPHRASTVLSDQMEGVETRSTAEP